jgi:aminoglycoside phosphotransferase (APT) family kinase protein
MHQHEIKIDKMLVHHLIKEQCPQWQHLPLTPLVSSGTDHALFRLGHEYVIRLPRIDWAVASLDKEFKWLGQIATFLKTPISTPVYKGHPDKSYPWPWIVLEWNQGHNPEFETGNEYEYLAQDLAIFLNELHVIKLPNGPLSRRGVPLKELDEETTKAIGELKEDIDVPSVSTLWHQLSQISSWTHEPVWIHGDFLPGNILVQNNRLSAVIDFSDLGIGDPACDMIIAWALFNSHSRNVFRNHLKNIDNNTWERGRGWALSIALIMLPYYKHSNPTLAKLAKRIIENVLNEHQKTN